ncbi:ATP-binding protein [Natronomonas marina]|uniref:ATP-binding protein n=1 Tax=Natronomonas marina TaxID=2961939 RepID=UPI0020C96CB4|nr:ATP-binding protein [Natronomonas marina]
MVSTVDGLIVVGILAGGVLCWFGYRAYALSERLGRLSFVAFTTILGTGSIVAGGAGLVPSVFPVGGEGSTWAQLPLLFWLLATLPWFVFAVQYTGTRTHISPRTLGILALPYLAIVVDLLLSILDIGGFPLFNVLGSVVFIYIISLSIGGVYLLMQNTYSYGHTVVWQGVALAVVMVGSLMIWNLMGMQANDTVSQAGAYAAGALVAAAGVGNAWQRYDLFDSTPSIGTLGERALTGETDDLMFVVDSEDRLITINETAIETLSVTRSNAHGSPISDVLGQDSEQLRRVETVTLQTTEGARQYDPQVSRVGDGHDNDIGATLSLRDVTDRNLREQRLAVLNRVLRHNLRNEVDVVKSHAERLARDDEAVDPIIDAADNIAALGQQARRIDRYVSETTEDVTVDLDAVVRSALETVEAEEGDVTVSVETPASATLTTNRRAVVGALESVLDNAVRYADSAVTVTIDPRPDGYVVRVADDGPGIPDSELESLDAGTESPLQHSTGLGLWQLKWAVTTLNGELSFDTTDGTTVEIVVPDRADERAAS